MYLPVMLVTAAGEAGSASPISVHWWTYVFEVLNVLVVLFVLTKFLFKPVRDLMREREQHVEASLSQAERAQTEAEKTLAEYHDKMQTAQQKVDEMLAKAAKEAREYQQKRQQEADTEYGRLVAEAKKDIAIERERALASIRDQVASLVVLAAGKVVEKSIDEKDHRHLVDEFLERVGDAQ